MNCPAGIASAMARISAGGVIPTHHDTGKQNAFFTCRSDGQHIKVLNTHILLEAILGIKGVATPEMPRISDFNPSRSEMQISGLDRPPLDNDAVDPQGIHTETEKTPGV